MGLNALFQRFFKQEPETIAFADLKEWIESKQQQEDRTELIENRKQQFIEDLDKHITILEAMNLENKKSTPRIKAITMGNLNKYIEHLHTLKQQPEALLEFYQKTQKNYQRATLLIGQELSDTKKTIADFARFIEKNKDENATIRARIKTAIESMENNDLKAIQKKIKEVEKKQQEKQREEQQRKNDIKKHNEKAQQQRAAYETNNKAMKANILKLKMMIDFKKLSNTFHASKEMNIVKKYRESFETSLEDDKTLTKLLEEAKMSNKEITALIKIIQQQRKALQPPTIKESHYTPSSSSKELVKEQKRLEKAKQERKELIASIRTDLEKMDVILEI